MHAKSNAHWGQIWRQQMSSPMPTWGRMSKSLLKMPPSFSLLKIPSSLVILLANGYRPRDPKSSHVWSGRLWTKRLLPFLHRLCHSLPCLVPNLPWWWVQVAFAICCSCSSTSPTPKSQSCRWRKGGGIPTYGGWTWCGCWRQQPNARKCKPSSTLPNLYLLCTKAKSLYTCVSWVSFHYQMSLWRHGQLLKKQKQKSYRCSLEMRYNFNFDILSKLSTMSKQQNGWNP